MELTFTKIGKYQIESELGRGGMAVVYKAIDTTNGATVALKVLPPTLATHENTLQRFIREGQNAARLQHENIVQIYEAGAADGYNYIAMELVHGQPLDEQIAENGQLFAIDECIALLSEIASSLDYAHSKGIIHRDIKPANILISSKGRVKLADFGVARQLYMDQTMYTAVGQSVGTPAYMSPEQARGQEHIDFRSDVYSFGVLAYKLFTGRVPFHSADQLQIMRQVVLDTPLLVHEINPDIPLHISQTIQKCLAKDPSQRFESAGAFMGALMRGYTPQKRSDKNAEHSSNIFRLAKNRSGSGLTWYDNTIGKMRKRKLDTTQDSYAKAETHSSPQSWSQHHETQNQHTQSRRTQSQHTQSQRTQGNRRVGKLTLALTTLCFIAAALFLGSAWLERQAAVEQQVAIEQLTKQIENRIGEVDPVDLSKSGINAVKEKTASLAESSSELATNAADAVSERANDIGATIEEQTADIELPEEEIGTLVNTVWYPKHSVQQLGQSISKRFSATTEWISNLISGDSDQGSQQ